jgi:hypothetical protein
MVMLPALRLREDYKGRFVCMPRPSPVLSTSASDRIVLKVIEDLAGTLVTFV